MSTIPILKLGATGKYVRTLQRAYNERGRSRGFPALEVDGQLVLGVINHPHDRRRYWGARGERARCAPTSGGRVSGPERTPVVSSTSELSAARFMALPSVPSPALDRLAAASTLVPTTMDFFVDLVEGDIVILLSQGGEIWDHAAGSFVVEQAGGRVTDIDGRPLEFTHGRTFPTSRGVIATDGRFHYDVVAAVQQVVGA